MEACLVTCIRRSLDLFCHTNAIFLAERLTAAFPSESNRLLLAQCYYRSNQPQRAYHVLKGSKSGQCRYLLALVCLDLQLLGEAETALVPSHLAAADAAAAVPNGAAGLYLLGLICRRTDRQQAAVQHLSAALAQDPFLWCAYEELCRLGAEEEAARVYGEAAEVAAEQVVQQQPPAGGQVGQEEEARSSASPQHMRAPPAVGTLLAEALGGGTRSLPASPSAFSTPPHSTLQGFHAPPPPMAKVAQPQQPSATSTDSHGGAGDLSPRTVNPGTTPAGGRRKFVDEGKLRKVAGRLFAEPGGLRRSTRLAESAAVGAAGGSSRSSGRSGGGSAGTTGGERISSGAMGERPRYLGLRRGGEAGGPDESGQRGGEWTAGTSVEAGAASSSSSSSSSRAQAAAVLRQTAGRASRATTVSFGRGGGGGSEGEAELQWADAPPPLAGAPQGLGPAPGNRDGSSGSAVEGVHDLMALLRQLGHAYRLLCMLRCQEAVEALQQLPPHHYATAWVLCQVGRAHYEMVEYADAARAFRWARRVAPYRTEGLDIFSSVLYHLKRNVELSHLAQEAVALDRLAPEAWCVMGNCMSAHQEHEAALKFFQRSLQLDPAFTYAHTLCGHEHVAMEQFEEGMACYRAALRLDARHYNAWYGLGSIYLRQEKPELAEYHFRRSLQINSRSSVLHCYRGMALHALKRNGEALEELQRAASWDARNPLPLFERATVLLAEGRLPEALEQALDLSHVASREASVFFLLAQIYTKLEQPEKAMLHLHIALDLKPSAAETNNIKAAMEKLHVPDQLEEGESPAAT